MTPDDVRKRVEAIREGAGDDEGAHSMEDGLRGDLLQAIVDGTCTDIIECARIALTTNQIEFARWCA